MFNTNLRKQDWYKTGERVLVEVGDVLEYDVRVPDTEALSRGCAYLRCPDPDSVGFMRRECACKRGVVYCSVGCQNA